MQQSQVKRLYHGALPTSAGVIFTASGKRQLVMNFLFHNSSGASRDVEVWLVPTGGARGSDNKIMKKTFADTDTLQFKIQVPMEVADELHALASGADVSIFVNGAELTEL